MLKPARDFGDDITPPPPEYSEHTSEVEEDKPISGDNSSLSLQHSQHQEIDATTSPRTPPDGSTLQDEKKTGELLFLFQYYILSIVCTSMKN